MNSPTRVAPLLGLCLSCASPAAPPSADAPREVTSFSLRRNTLWGAASLDGEQLAILDEEVIRVLDLSGDEVWGRRLSIGALQTVTACGGGWFVLGAEGGAFLDSDGLQKGQPSARPAFVTLDSHGGCAFDTPGRGTWLSDGARYTSDGNTTLSLSGGVLTAPTWQAKISCDGDCPLAIWGDVVAVAEGAKLTLLSLKDGARIGALAPGEARIISVTAAPGALLLSRDDGAVALWRGDPRQE